MKAFKRISAVVIALAMMMSCAFSTVAFADEKFNDIASDNLYYKAIIDLVDKGIINGYDNGDSTFSFKPDGNITRAEFAKMIAAADAPAGYAFTATTSSFADVAADAEWAIPYIEYASARKIVNGFEDGTFRANEPVTYAQALKMIVCALNYGFAANATDPWYQTYITLANQLNITKNAMGTPDAPAVRGLVAQLIYNMNNTTPAVQTGTDANGNPIYGASSSIKQEEDGTKTKEGQLLAVFNKTITGENEGLNKKEALVMVKNDEEVFLIGNYSVEEIAELLGYEVKIIYSENGSGDKVIEKITKTTSNETYVIADIDISEVTETSIEYFDKDAKNGVDELKFDSDMKVLKNGGAIDMDNLVDELSIDSGDITFIDYDGNNRMDVAFIKSYETMYVGSVTKSNGIYTVYDKFDSTRKFPFDEDSDDITVKVAANGSNSLTTGTLSSIATSNIISVAVSAADENDIEIVVSKKTASGSSSTSEIKSINNDNQTIKIGNTDYNMSNYYISNLGATTYPQALSVGDVCKVYLDFTGKIAAVDKTETSQSYGYITKVGPASTGMDADDYLVRMYDTSGKLYDKLPIASKGFKINGSSAQPADLVTAIETAAALVNEDKDESKIVNADQAVLVKYEISNGTLKSVYLVDEDSGTGISPKYISAGTQVLTFHSSSNSFRVNGTSQFSISASTKVFVVPLNRNDSNYRVTTGTSYFTNGLTYMVDAFDADGSAPAKAVVVYGVSTAIKANADTILVKSITTDSNNEGEVVQKLTYYTLGSTEEKEIMSKEDDTFNGVEPGDVIRILTIGSEVDRIQHIFDASEKELLTADVIEDGGSYNANTGMLYQSTGSSEYFAMYGTVVLKPGDTDGAGGDTMRVSVDGNEDHYEGFTLSKSTSIIKYTNDGSGRSEVFEFDKIANDIMDINPDPDAASKVLVIRYSSSAVKGIIIYE